MQISKKGISPLIATVLIIGFTIILAAMVFQWGGDLFKQVQEETGAASEAKITCTSGLTNLDVSAETDASSAIVLTLDNKNNVDVTGFRARAYNGDGTVSAGESAAVLPAYGIMNFNMNTDLTMVPAISSPSQIGVFPKITLDNGDIATCETEIKVNVV